MPPTSKQIPVKCNTDLAAEYYDQETALFIKNVTTYVSATDAYGPDVKEGQNQLKLKPLQSNELYANIPLPPGENFTIHAKGFAQVNRVYVWVWNSLGNHFIYRVNGNSRANEIVYKSPCLNFQLKPEYFIHEAGSWLEVVYLVDPVTGATIEKEDLYWSDGYNPQGYLRTNDSIASDSFNEVQYPYFKGDYDRCTLSRMGVPTPMDCIKVHEIPNISDEVNNNIKFRGLQFRILGIDVWGRPTEHGIISDLYIWGGNDCASDNGARCLRLDITVTNPIIDKLQIETSEDNSTTWHITDIIDLYKGSNFKDWWLRARNPDLPFDPTTSTYSYTYCNNKENIPIDPAETNRTQNPISNTSQSLFKLNRNIALANNSYGFAPFSRDLMSNISVELIEQPAIIGDRRADIFVAIYNPIASQQQPIWPATVDGVPNTGVVGGVLVINPTLRTKNINSVIDRQQVFTNAEQRGFIGVLAGTGEPPITAVSEQYYLDTVTNELIKLNNYDDFDFNKKYFQKFSFTNLKAGKYIFQLCSIVAKLSDNQYWKTSTSLSGAFNFNPLTSVVDYNNQVSTNKQFVLDLCEQNYSTLDDDRMLVIYDLSSATVLGFGENCSARSGYIYESIIDGSGVNPIELLHQSLSIGDGEVGNPGGHSTTFTDHNGFYFYLITSNLGFSINFKGYCSNEYKTVLRTLYSSSTMNRKYNLTTEGLCLGYVNRNCNRILLKGRVVDCDTGVGMAGIGVLYFRSGYFITNEAGEFTIVVHDNATSASLNRIDNLYYIQNICGYIDCNNNMCIQEVQVIIPFPVPLNPCMLREAFVDNLSVRGISINHTAHLLSGGQYAAGIVGHDWLRRHGFVQTTDKLYFNVPTLAQSNGKYYTPRIIINPNATFPDWVTLLTPVITEELTIEDYIEWIVDKFVFIDNSGNENNEAPTQIKIFYASLPEYNSQNEFNTTTGWQFLTEATEVPRTSDYVDFIVNGDGAYFQQAVRQIVKYNKDGDYFLINYDSNLRNLKKYARIRLVRPKVTNSETKFFFELCAPVKILNNKAVQNSIKLPAFDTYNVYRQIPIPVTVGEDTINEIITFGVPFEHHSPNDLWGYKIKNIGRVFSTNPYEVEILKINEVALSGGMSDNGVLNYLSYFDSAKTTNFDVNNTGGIVAGFADIPGLVRFITQYSTFFVGYNDNLGRVNADGTFQAPSIPNSFGKPQPPAGGATVGCQLKDKNAIGIRKGLVSFPDRNMGEVFQYDYSSVISYTKNVCDAWFKAKCREMSKDPSRFFTKSIDPNSNEYLLTDFSLTVKKYINDLRTYDARANETVCFDMESKVLRGWRSFLGECYASLDGDILNKQMFAFKGALPYSFYNLGQNKSYNKFFGVQCEPVIELVIHSPLFAVAKWLSLANYCKERLFWSDKIITQSGQKSRIFLGSFTKADFISFAPFLCDINTPQDINLPESINTNPLIEGNPLYGTWVTVRLIGDQSNGDAYFEFLGSTVDYFIEEKTG